MRAIILLLCLVAPPLSAETILTNSKITAVTVYPAGAQLTRVVTFDARAGSHDLLVTNLPQDSDPRALRLRPVDGVQIGAYVLRTDRIVPRDAVKSDARIAAEAALEKAADAVNAAQITRDGVAARITAAQAQIDYLSRLGASDAKTETDMLQATSRMIGAEVLAATQAILAARLDLPGTERDLKKALEGQANAQAALDALALVGTDHATLSLSIVTNTDGPHQLEVTQFVPAASWSPVYDAALDRAAGHVMLDRALLVSQSTGEDWEGVALTLSTAQPGNRAAPSALWPQLHRIDDPVDRARASAEAEFMADAAPTPIAEPSLDAAYKVGVAFQGDIVNYAYPALVDIADGVEDLRLALDQLTLPASVQAQAVPRHDDTAFVMAEITNDSGEVLLPGTAFLSRDGAYVGATDLQTVAAGGKLSLGFGAVEGLRLKRLMPARAEGDRGLFSKSNQIEEKAVLSVENLTGEAWDLRVMDLVPYSEQEDLVITYIATPSVTEADVDGQRGLLAWDWSLAAGETLEITLSTLESWPEGKELNGGRW